VQHVEASAELVRGIASVFDGPAAPKFATTIATSFPSLLGPDEHDALATMVDAVDHVVMYSGNLQRNQVVADLAARAEPRREATMLITRIRIGDAGGTPHATPVSGAEIADNDFQEGARLGVSELGLYNYGLLRDEDVGDFMAGVRSVFGET
jgi:hypothetical protein